MSASLKKLYPWETPKWEDKSSDQIRAAYVQWLKPFSWDLFVSVNFRQTEIRSKAGLRIRWGTSSDVAARVKVMDARINKSLFGRHWASKSRERFVWAGFIERDEDGYPHAHLFVILKGIGLERFKAEFEQAARYFSPQTDLRDGAFKQITCSDGALFYCTKFANKEWKDFEFIASPTFKLEAQSKDVKSL